MKKLIVLLILFNQLYLFGQEIKFGKVSKEELEEKFHPIDSTASAAYLYKKRRTFYQYDFSTGFQLVTEIHERIKIYNKHGFEFANKSIAYLTPESGDRQSVSSIKGITFSLVNGKIEQEKLSKKSIFKEKKNIYYSFKKIAMPNVKIGSVLDIKYKIISPYSSSISVLDFQEAIPVNKLNYKIEIPEFFKFSKTSKGYYSVKMTKESKSGKISGLNYVVDIFSYQANHIPALKDDEPFINNIDNYRGGIKFELKEVNTLRIGGSYTTFSNSWNSVSKRIYKAISFGDELSKKSYFNNDLQNILANTTSEFDKIAAIFYHVKSKVKWNGFYSKYTENGVKKAYKEGVGNVADII